MKRILVFGGRGLLGEALGRRAASRGTAISLLSRLDCNITRDEQIDLALKTHRPSVVINCAAWTAVDACENDPAKADRINGEAIGHLAKFASAGGAKLVHFSSDYVFDGKTTTPYREDAPVNPLSVYGRSKALGERELSKHGDDWLLIRTAWLFGQGGVSFPRRLVDRAKAGETLRVVSDQIGSPTFADDLADATLDLVAADASGLLHVANAGAASWFDVAKAALATFGIHANVEPISTAQWRTIRPAQAVRPGYSVLDHSRIATTFGRTMRDWREAMQAYAETTRGCS